MEPERPIALITGGARRVGAAVMEHLAAKGWDLVLHYNRSIREAEELAFEFEETNDCHVYLERADLVDPLQRRELCARISDQLESAGRPLDLLVNNASIFPRCRLEEMDDPLVDQLFAVHLKAPLFIARDLAPCLRAAPDGVVINMLDAGAGRYWPAYLPYCLSKQALREATLGLAKVLAPGIRVCGIAPGFVLPPEEAPEVYMRAQGRKLLKRDGSPEDVLRALDYIVEARFVTGVILEADGGKGLAR